MFNIGIWNGHDERKRFYILFRLIGRTRNWRVPCVSVYITLILPSPRLGLTASMKFMNSHSWHRTGHLDWPKTTWSISISLRVLCPRPPRAGRKMKGPLTFSVWKLANVRGADAQRQCTRAVRRNDVRWHQRKFIQNVITLPLRIRTMVACMGSKRRRRTHTPYAGMRVRCEVNEEEKMCTVCSRLMKTNDIARGRRQNLYIKLDVWRQQKKEENNERTRRNEAERKKENENSNVIEWMLMLSSARLRRWWKGPLLPSTMSPLSALRSALIANIHFNFTCNFRRCVVPRTQSRTERQ